MLARNVIISNRLSEKIEFVSIVGFEYEILTAKHIEIFAGIECHVLIKTLRNIAKNNGKERLFTCTRKDPNFNYLYQKVTDKAKRELMSKNKIIDNKLLKHKITFEAMCKYLFSDAFKNDLFINKLFGKCWEKDCCFKKNRQCNILGDINFSAVQKKLFLVQFSEYINIVKRISTIFNIKARNIKEIDIKNVLQTCVDNET